MHRVVILGAAGRDFHDFNVVFRDDPEREVVAFTAAQIPGIDDRRYPAELAGPRYPNGIPIRPERELERLVHDMHVDEAVLAYSDLAHAEVMHLASRVLATGASFHLLAPRRTMLRSSRPVIAVTAVRTGCGKSPVSRAIVRMLGDRKTVVVRHPMPYGNLVAQRIQRFAERADLDRANVTIEEREEYEPHIENGTIVYAGVDYEPILRAAESEADVILWDGGNNDTPFFEPSLWIVLVDPLRAGHELGYHPGETNLRAADIVVVTKVDSAPPDRVEQVIANVRAVRSDVPIVRARSEIQVSSPERVRGKRVLLIEDGPTLTHGGMAFGAAKVAADRLEATIVDPRPFAVGSIAETFAKYPHLGPCVPAMGYSPRQIRDLEATIACIDCDAVLVGTPIDLARIARIARPVVRARYEIGELPELREAVGRCL